MEKSSARERKRTKESFLLSAQSPQTEKSLELPANSTCQRPVISFSPNMATSQNISSSATLVLFTPVIAALGTGTTSNQTDKQVDPFEVLGRALSHHYKRIRHVPYLPKVGLTQTHDAFLSQADAVVVVICESESERHKDLGNQVDFAESAQDVLQSHFGRPCRIPFVLVQCGDPSGTFWPDTLHFDNVVKCRTWHSGMAQQVARKLSENKK